MTLTLHIRLLIHVKTFTLTRKLIFATPYLKYLFFRSLKTLEIFVAVFAYIYDGLCRLAFTFMLIARVASLSSSISLALVTPTNNYAPPFNIWIDFLLANDVTNIVISLASDLVGAMNHGRGGDMNHDVSFELLCSTIATYCSSTR